VATSHFRKEVTAKDLNLKILDGFASRHGPKTLAEESKSTLKRPEEVMETAGFTGTIWAQSAILA